MNHRYIIIEFYYIIHTFWQVIDLSGVNYRS